MLPSLLTREIQAGLERFLLRAYEPSNEFFQGMMARFLAREGAWLKGPYLQLGLPFRPGERGRDFFSDFQTRFPAYVHQEAAWARLHRGGAAANTIIATGTGSGKTECFLYPVLEHCARERATRGSAPGGIRVLIIYPMNALATDQARRIAETIHANPAFAGLRAGLYIGDGGSGRGGGTVMTPTALITDRATLRSHPPDLLLTNYKMLDYLLIRPQDRALWSKNGPDTLRFIVVDELHTFDGAQGTDLALLLRRLKHRLGAPEGAVTHIGTSATLGSARDTGPLREYAGQVFSSPFPPESVITENRLRVEEFLDAGTVSFLLEARSDLGALLDPARYDRPAAAVAAWFPLFFPGEPVPEDVNEPAWRQLLGTLLKRHSLMVALLRAMEPGAPTLDELKTVLAQHVAGPIVPQLGRVLDALLVLVAWARSADGSDLPLVMLRLQVWVRELRRMVGPVTTGTPPADLMPECDLPAEPSRIHLPLIQCQDCKTTGWLGRLPTQADNCVHMKLDEIYNGWFGGSAEAVRLYPSMDADKAQGNGVSNWLCSACGVLNPRSGECSRCGSGDLVGVFRTTGATTVKRGSRTAVFHDRTCPNCGSDSALMLIGSRSTTLGAEVVERTWASRFNDDKKLIAFSDSVQDAAHRAGFISARTYNHAVRKAIARGIEHLVEGRMPWSEFRESFRTLWRQPESPLAMDRARFVSEFIAPNMTWQPGWVNLYQDGATLPADSALPDLVERRLSWQAFAEFTYGGNRGRTLDYLGVATLAPAVADILVAARSLTSVLQNSFGLRVGEAAVFQWLWGVVIHLRRRGAVNEPVMSGYVADGSLFHLTRGADRRLWMPGLGPSSPRPIFPSFEGGRKGFEPVIGARVKSWYQHWLEATLARDSALLPSDRASLYLAAVKELQAVGVAVVWGVGGRITAGLNPERLYLHTGPLQLRTRDGARTLTAPAEAATHLLDMPCLEEPSRAYTAIERPPAADGEFFRRADLRRVIAAEHTGLLEAGERGRLEGRFKAKSPEPWYENLLSATPTLEMGVDIGDLSSVLLCSAPPTVSSFLQRVGRAGRRDGNACATTMIDAVSPHDLYFYEDPAEMQSGEVLPPGVFLKAPEVLRRQYVAFCLDHWVKHTVDPDILPDQLGPVLDAVDRADPKRFPNTFIEHSLRHRPELFETFIDLLGENADEAVIARLRAFVEGSDAADSMTVRILRELRELSDERAEYERRIKGSGGIAERLKKLAKPHLDEKDTQERTELEKERGKLQELIAEIKSRPLLQALTDAGLIPNYAFPENGILLKSLLWRKAVPEDHVKSDYVTLKALSYERPASSALGEFAPESRFYATQRRVEIDQIHMGLSKLEEWRLCPKCDHMENLEVSRDPHPACPRCGDAMWSDSAQRRLLLRFRQAIANSDDTEVRIDDSAEERERCFHLRQLLVDFPPEEIVEAWKLKSNLIPFGFEFIASACFRDINFGELGKPGARFSVADREAPRPGFRVCGKCGKVQQPPKAGAQDDTDSRQDHAIDCVERESNDEDNLLQCLYLYREFHSEALRILVPFTQLGLDDRVVQSFSAALQLGLKRRFGGQVDHIRVTFQDVPDPTGGPKRRFLLLYDSVPGGTGYLHQLLAHDAQTLKDAFALALRTIEECPCRENPERDGCYRCVFQYRLGRSMELVSRLTALAVMRDLVGSLDQLERTGTISAIGLNHALDSYLEQRFIESFKALSQKGDLPTITVIQEVVNGRQGYHLKVGDHTYAVEPQVDLGHSEGVKRPSRPDFVIRPLSSKLKRRPIAVFCDGWTFHKESLRDDAAKRTAILNSGRYWVWSVELHDVEAAIIGGTEAVLCSAYQAKVNTSSRQPPPGSRPPDCSTFTRNSVAELLHWLASPVADDGDTWVTNAWRASMGWLLRLASSSRGEVERVRGENQALRSLLPTWLPDVPEKSVEVTLNMTTLFTVRGVYPLQVHKQEDRTVRVPTVLWFDDAAEADEDERRSEWRWWLWAFNWFQTVPGTVLVTRVGVDGQDYSGLLPTSAEDAGYSSGAPATPGADWSESFDAMLTAMAPEARRLATLGVPPPDEVGYSLISAEGEELSMAELAWVEQRLAVLTEDYARDAAVWEAAGWRVVVSEGAWASRVLAEFPDVEGVNR